MTKQPYTIALTVTLADAHRTMREHHIRVMGRDGVEGVFTSVNACLVLAELLRRPEA